MSNLYNVNLVAANVDDLVVQGITHIRECGQRIDVTAGPGTQAFGVNYILENSRARLHTLRHPVSTRYLCRELLAYFQGSLNVHEGLGQASGIWENVADENHLINSNYGFYVFRQEASGGSQYNWVVANLRRNLQSRRALININQVSHKDLSTKDFPCTVGIQFFVRQGALCCEASSRSVDVLLGLPYDIAFFSFLNELVCQDLRDSSPYAIDLTLGYTMIKTSFTQIYDATSHKADEVMAKNAVPSDALPTFAMPPIGNPRLTLQDIYNGTRHSEIVEWIYHNAKW